MSGSYIGKNPQYGFFEKQRITTANGVLTAFNLSFTCADANQLLVSVAGVIQEGGQAYSVLSGTPQQISFTEAPATGVEIFIVWLGKQTTGPTFASGMLTGKTALGAQPDAADTFLLYDDTASILKKVTYANLIPTTHGDVSGPVSSTNNALARFDEATGKIIQNSTALLTDAGTLTATAFSGPLTGNVTGNVTGNASGTAATVTGATQASITSIANLVTVGTIGTGTWQGTAIANAYIGTTIDATKLADGTVTNAEFQYINSLTSNAQTQINAKGVGDALLGSAQEWTAQQNFNNTALVFDATQDWALAANQVATLTLTANTTFDAPTQMVDGSFYSLIIIQDATGSRTASWNGVFKWAAATAPTLTTTASAKDIFVWRSDGTNMYEVGRQLNVS
jgi:hypothetical protein